MKRLDFISLICTIITSIACFFAGEALLKMYSTDIPDFLMMGIYFLAISFILIVFTHLIVFIISPIKNLLPSRIVFIKSLCLLTFIAMALSFILGSAFQYIYSLGSRAKKSNIDNYVVAIDNSGSMQDSDPDYKRFDALKELFSEVKDRDLTFSVYVFSDDYELAMPTKQITEQDINDFDDYFSRYKYSDQGTEVMNMLTKVNDDVTDGIISTKTSVIVISDGECDVDENVLLGLLDINVPVNTIGFYSQSGIQSLRQIAEGTAGEYYHIEDVSGIITSLREITNKYYDQNLVGPRDNENESSLFYIMLRIMFLFIIIASIKIIQSLSIDIESLRKELFMFCFLFALIGSVATELLFLKSDLSESFIRYGLVLTIALMFIGLKQSDVIDGNLLENSNVYKNSINNSFDKDNSDKNRLK